MRFVVNLARWLNLSVVAEGVETRAQLERLREVGCDYVQGYFFSRPLPVAEFEKLLAEQAVHPMDSIVEQPETPEQKVLIVADADKTYRQRVRVTFEGMYQVEETADGESAFCMVQEYGKNRVVAVILGMDLPNDGAAAFLRTLRNDPVLWRIPVLSAIPPEMVSDEFVQQLDTDDFLCKNHPMCDLRRRAARMVGVTSCRQKALDLENEACRDYQTGLLNRRGLEAAVDALRLEDLPVAVYLFDLDNLKQVNDAYGHEAGDSLLRSFAQVLQRHTRDSDLLCRYGGDEFMVILRHISSQEIVLRKGEAICREFHDMKLPNGIQASCSGGVVLAQKDEKPSQKLFDQADVALYRSKRTQKGSCCLWEAPEAELAAST